MTIAFLFTALFGLLIIGAPIAVALGLSSVATIMLFSGERSGESGLARRLINMMGGVDRVAAAPILGVPRVKPGDRAFPHILEFSYPHNEYLMIWMFYGLLGLIAYLYLFAVLFYLNVRHRMSVKWLLVYFGMMVQMLVDIAFFDFQITTIFFIIVGLNIREMYRKDAAALTKAGSPAVPLRVLPTAPGGHRSQQKLPPP